MRLKKPPPTLSFVTFLLFPALSASAQDWPQWRGPGRDGVLSSFSEPKSWPEKLTKRWQVTAGSGHSSPVVSNRRVYLLTRQGEEEVISCFDLNTGKLLWRDSYPAPYSMNPAAAAHGKGPKSTPVVSGGKLFTFGIAGTLSCYDAAAGKLRWRKDFSSQFPFTSPYFGSAMSPLVLDGLVVTHVGGHDNGALIAMDVETGGVKWSWKGDGPAYASPILVELGGLRQIVTQSQKSLIGISVRDGELLWSIPFATEYVQNIVTPVLHDQDLIFSGVNKGVLAFRLVRDGERLIPEKVWENSEASFYMSTPVLFGDMLFGLSHKNKGQFVCLDANTGHKLWSSEGRQGENAALVRGGDRLFLLTNDSDLIVAKAGGQGFEIVRKYQVADSPTWAHPVMIGNGILIKDAEKLTFWSLE